MLCQLGESVSAISQQLIAMLHLGTGILMMTTVFGAVAVHIRVVSFHESHVFDFEAHSLAHGVAAMRRFGKCPQDVGKDCVVIGMAYKEAPD